jgi:hypothetical protein
MIFYTTCETTYCLEAVLWLLLQDEEAQDGGI